MDRFYSQFWIDYCTGDLDLNPLFSDKDSTMLEKTYEDQLNDNTATDYGGRVRTNAKNYDWIPD